MKMAKPKTPDTITAFKGFDKDFSCRGFKYEIGRSYTHDGEISLCQAGFHACEAPLDVWNYYPPTDGNQVAQVELGGVSNQRENDTKRVGKSITIKAALSIPALIAAQIEWTFNAAKKSEKVNGVEKTVASSGHSSEAASSGDSSTAASSGHYSKAASSGHYSKAASSGDSSTAASSGDYSKAACGPNGFACVAGFGGLVKGNAGSALSLGYQDARGRNRIAVGYVGENGIQADTWYRASERGELVPA